MCKTNTNELVSLVIPVYNEAPHLAACLRAIARQTVLPYQVIVVDNNSTDGSSSIAASFSFVQLLHEPRQGVVHARSTGFNAASGSIIGRIDADTIIADNWIESLQRIFKESDIDAVSGSVYYYDIPTPRLSGVLDLYFRQRLADQLGSETFLYGANMAIKAETWRTIAGQTCTAAGLHEDFDLAIHAESSGAVVVFDRTLQASVSLRRFEGGLRDFWHYTQLSPQTYKRHGRTSQRHMYSVIFIVIVMYWFIWLNHAIYDADQQRVSYKRLLSGGTVGRVNPATFVD
jgi:glycosyltransferase involved in cell wall biosynthesis